jgi:small subunit ribosomal protein S8
MSISDPIADMLTRLRNATMVRHSHVLIPASKLKIEIARILKEEGYILDYEVTEDRPQPIIRIHLRYGLGRKSVLSGLRRVSRPGRRTYTGSRDIPWVLNGMGVAILSTPKGVLTGREARRQGVGGEVVCYVW